MTVARRNDPQGVTAAMRLRRILELRTLGQTLEQIGADPQVNRAKSNVKKQLDKALDAMAAENAGATLRYKALAYARLERLLAKAMLRALSGAGDVQAMREARNLIAAQARVMGFEAPIKHASTDPSGEHERPPGLWTLPMRPTVTIEDWQAQAEGVWQAQLERERSQSA